MLRCAWRFVVFVIRRNVSLRNARALPHWPFPHTYLNREHGSGVPAFSDRGTSRPRDSKHSDAEQRPASAARVPRNDTYDTRCFAVITRADAGPSTLAACIDDDRQWYPQNGLQLNADKSEDCRHGEWAVCRWLNLIISIRRRCGSSDRRLTFNRHVSMVARSCNSVIRRHFRHLLSTELAQTLACSLILSSASRRTDRHYPETAASPEQCSSDCTAGVEAIPRQAVTAPVALVASPAADHIVLFLYH